MQETAPEGTEALILAAAREVFLEQGMAGARMQDIADRAGITKSLLHYYFRSKDKLFRLILREAMQEFLPALHEEFRQTRDLEGMIRSFVPAYLHILAERPYLPSFVIREIDQEPELLLAMMTEVSAEPLPFRRFAATVAEESARGTIRAIDARHLWSHMMGLCMFPFLAAPMLRAMFQMDRAAYDAFLQERGEEIVTFLLCSLEPRP